MPCMSKKQFVEDSLTPSSTTVAYDRLAVISTTMLFLFLLHSYHVTTLLRMERLELERLNTKINEQSYILGETPKATVRY